MKKQFLDLILAAKNILVTSHISPDSDAISSSLLLARGLETNFPSKKVSLVLEERPAQDLSFLNSYRKIKFQPLDQALTQLKPDLLIMTDANSYSRCSRQAGPAVAQYILQNHLKSIIIDHHEAAGRDKSDLYINNHYPAATQEVYELLFGKLRLKKPLGYAQATLLGIVSDTLRFKYTNPKHRETFQLVSELLDQGEDIEKLENRLERYSQDQLKVIGHLATNLTLDHSGYTYSFVSDDFKRQWLKHHRPQADFKAGCEAFVNRYVRNVNGNNWGFIVYPELASGDNHYAVSFRALSGTVDVSIIARSLGGGGHKPAAGVKIRAANVDEAVAITKRAIQLPS